MIEKKILQISTTPLQYDGLSKVLISLVEYSPKGLRHYVALAMGGEEALIEKLKSMGAVVIFLPDRQQGLSSYIRGLSEALKETDFDVVHVHGNSATMVIEMFYAKRAKITTRIAHAHNTKTNHPVVHGLMKPFLSAFTNKPVACGQEAGHFLFSKDFFVLPNSVEVDKFRFSEEIREKARKELGLSEEILIGHVGRFSYQKNHDKIIDIFQAVTQIDNSAKLLLIGQGEDKERIEKLTEKKQLKDRIIILGVRSDINELMQAMDVFLLPSRYEGLSVTAIEAQAAGLFVCASTAVSPETDKSGLCTFIPLDAEDKDWAGQILKRAKENRDRTFGAKKVQESGYDISDLTDKIKEIWGGY